jgi:5'-3' exonuclease
MSTVQRVHLVDGTFELFRAHFSKTPDRQTPDGRPAKATIGVVRSLLTLLHDRDEAVTHLAVAFDNPIESFRNDLFGGYKTGAGIPWELASQFDAVEDAVRALGIVVWSMDRWEADDALATAATRFASQVSQVRILTPDKDLGQCLCGTEIVQVDRIRRRVIDEAALRARWAFGPASIPDFLALVGDTADGIPGLTGFGEKTASNLLSAYGHLEQIPLDHRSWHRSIRGADRLAATLRAQVQAALLYRLLATLVRDVPLAEDLDALGWAGLPRERFGAWCRSVGAMDLLERNS